jgi:hypothetical protein
LISLRPSPRSSPRIHLVFRPPKTTSALPRC